MKILEREVEARERASATGVCSLPRKTHGRVLTGAALLTNNSGSGNRTPTYVYCGQAHTSTSCSTTADPTARKEIPRKAGRCYICLRKSQLSRNCRSALCCRTCRGRHHVSMCSRTNSDQGRQNPPSSRGSRDEPPIPPSTGGNAPSTSSLYVGSQTPILLQTAKMHLFNPTSRRPHLMAPAILNSGSRM